MALKPKVVMLLDFIGWNLLILAFVSFIYLGTTQDFATIKDAMAIVVPLAMIIGGGFFAWALGVLKTDKWMSGREMFDGLLWFIVSFGLIVTVEVGVVNTLSHRPFNVAFSIYDMVWYGIFIAIAEEIFRCFFLGFGAMLTHLFGPYVAVPISAGAWTVLHFAVYGTQPLALIIVFIVGVILGFILWSKRRLWIVMGAHALVNVLAWTVGTWLGTVIPIVLITTLVILWVYSRGRKQ